MSKRKDESEEFDPLEAQERFERALRGAVRTPPVPVPPQKKRARGPKPPRPSGSESD